MSEKTKAQLQAEIAAMKEELQKKQESIKSKSNKIDVLNGKLKYHDQEHLKHAEEVSALKAELEKEREAYQHIKLENNDLHEGLKMLQDQLAVARAEKGEEEKAKLLAIECMHKSNETARLYGLEIESLKGEVEMWQEFYREKTPLQCIREWFNFKKEALA